MPVATLNKKGQTTLPQIRDRLGLVPGDKLDFVIEGNGCVVLRRVTLDVRQLEGLLRRKSTRPVSQVQMERAIAGGAIRAPK